jgi:hypothetical protein
MDIQQAISEAADAAMATLPPAPVDAPPPEPAPPADPTPVEDAPDTPVEAEETPEPETPDLPEGYVAVPVVEDKLATEFVLKDAEGEVEIPALIVEYKANGKVRQDRLDQVVKLAQFGVYNESREQQFKQAESRLQELETIVVQREEQMERLLQDEEFFLTLRDAYEAENSPERRAERAERRVEEVQVATQMQAIQQQGEQFYSSEVRPAVDFIANALPTVTADELEERMAYAMQLHAKVAPNGQAYLPAAEYDALRKYIVDDLAIWAQATHARRSGTATPTSSAALTDATHAKVEAQKAKRAVGQATKPVGRPAAPSTGKPKATKPSTLDDALDSAMDEIMSSFR